MAMVEVINSSSYYYTQWQNAELKLVTELNLAGVKKASEGSSDLEFVEDRLKALRGSVDYWKNLYQTAYKIENNGSKYGRMRTYLNGT